MSWYDGLRFGDCLPEFCPLWFGVISPGLKLGGEVVGGGGGVRRVGSGGVFVGASEVGAVE